ncbi:MAG: SDR family oxidoreductase [Nitrospirae bacterium]|nr:SDR family oxidoreductase [Nitrospirota bacterium]
MRTRETRSRRKDDGRVGLEGKIALVTGAGRRLGRAIALALAEEGVHTIIHYRTERDGTDELLGELDRMGVKSWPLRADFEKEEQYNTLIAQALDMAGAVDIVINNASLFLPDTFETVTFANMARHLEVNAWVPFSLCRQFSRLVGRGEIVNLLDSRINGYDWTHVSYIVSKQTFASLTRMMAIRYAPGIRVNGVAPGLVLPPPGKKEGYLDKMAASVPLGRHGSPKDVTDAVIYLLRSGFVTGEILSVDGGRHVMEYTDGPHPH